MKDFFKDEKNMLTSILIAGGVGLVLGGTTVFIITKDKEEPIEQPSPVVVVGGDETSKAQQDVIKQVTSPDLVSVSCSKEHIDLHGDLLCREMFCRLQTRGIDSKTSGSECEEISNIANTKAILKSCVQKVKVDGEDLETSSLNEDCVDLFSKRK